ncbi:MAG: M23 family metallopeptidase, partial [bacterium]|nr:M23 family metallopeptidase [bacterium]
ELAVRDGQIDKTAARKVLPVIMAQVETQARRYSFAYGQNWIFPVQGSGVNDIAGNNGDLYQPDIVYGVSPVKGYDFFDGNKHGGHPAHDIFIRDVDQDCLDDRTHKPVPAVAMVDCLVLGTHTGWQNGSAIRSGNAVWLYNPNMQMIFYYAHLDKVMVKPGQLLKAGEVIGTVGRTGLLAEQKTSPTHLHLMVLQYQENGFKPYNYYANLK